VPTVSYPRALDLHAQRDPEGVAVVCGDRSITRDAFHRRSSRLARAFSGLGVGPGDWVSIALPNSIEFLEAAFAAWKIGAVPQPLSSHLPPRELAALVDLAKPSLLVGAEPGAHGGVRCVPVGFEPDPTLSDAPLPDAVSPHCHAIASGGSTGRPKLIVDAFPAECDPEESHYGLAPQAPVLVPGPLYHTGPFINARQALLRGGAVILMTRFDAAEALALIERHRVQWVNFVPTMLQRIWRLPEDVREAADLSSLDVVMVTGAACPAWLKRAWIDWLGPQKIWEAYGGSERIGGTVISGSEWLEHPGSVGRPTGGRQIRILDDSGGELPTGSVGEVYMMPPGGQGSTYRYLGASARATRDGWESLGDMGYVDDEGYLYLVDRRTDMIVTGGANVYPAEVEAALDAHPSVRSSAVIGLPDDDLGQRVHALVEAQPPVNEEELRAHLAEHLVRYKIPRSFEWVDEPLRDDAGKVRRWELREARTGGEK
jgi:bile acid-coenzyme A ligase